MMSAKYFMKFRGQEFEDHVLEKFHNLFPQMKGTEKLKLALEHIKFRSIVPVFKDNGEVDRRYKRGISNHLVAGCKPAAIASPLSPSKFDELCRRTPEQGPETFGMDKKYSKTIVDDYHKCQRELFEGLLKIKLDDDGRMLVNRSSNTVTTATITSVTTTTTKTITFTNGHDQATTEEFVQILDTVSKSVMKEYAALEQPTASAHYDLELQELNTKIDLCFVILIKRLLIQMHGMETLNDFMTEKGWKAWREHAWVVASFAVYFLSLQLYHYKKCGGSFLDMTE